MVFLLPDVEYIVYVEIKLLSHRTTCIPLQGVYPLIILWWSVGGHIGWYINVLGQLFFLPYTV